MWMRSFLMSAIGLLPLLVSACSQLRPSPPEAARKPVTASFSVAGMQIRGPFL